MILMSLKLDVCVNSQYYYCTSFLISNLNCMILSKLVIVGSRLLQMVMARCLKDNDAIFPSHRSTYIYTCLLSDDLVLFLCMSLSKENLSCR